MCEEQVATYVSGNSEINECAQPREYLTTRDKSSLLLFCMCVQHLCLLGTWIHAFEYTCAFHFKKYVDIYKKTNKPKFVSLCPRLFQPSIHKPVHRLEQGWSTCDQTVIVDECAHTFVWQVRLHYPSIPWACTQGRQVMAGQSARGFYRFLAAVMCACQKQHSQADSTRSSREKRGRELDGEAGREKNRQCVCPCINNLVIVDLLR